MPTSKFAFVDEASDFVTLIRLWARHGGDHKALSFLDAEGDESDTLTFAQLEQAACAFACQLLARADPGERAMLIYPPGLDFIRAFFGCLYAGIIPVPVYPPLRANRDASHLEAIAADCQPKLILCSDRTRALLEKALGSTPAFSGASWLTTDRFQDAPAGAWQQPDVTPDSLAFLQYTSGSTGNPKGVKVTHGNLIANQKMIRTAFSNDETFKGMVGWLPMYHDMGLIGNVMQSLFMGGPVYLMSPVHFLQRPMRWLEAISRYRTDVAGGPNFGYELCVRRSTPEQRAALDLSCWRLAYNGAERVSPAVLQRFTEAFAPSGFRAQAFYPCYGLAEATLFVTGGDRTEQPVVHEHASETLVGCGRVRSPLELKIVDPDTRLPCAEGEIGEIWLRGPSVAAGYWSKLEETEQTFQARLAHSNEGPFLKTGDLGFLKNDNLFVAGRLKDVLIVRGRNHYPEDIERTVLESSPAFHPGGGAAFGIEGTDADGERLVVAQEVSPRHVKSVDFAALKQTVQERVSHRHGLRIHALVLLPPGGMPKTSSGKVRRRACRSAFISGTLETLDG